MLTATPGYYLATTHASGGLPPPRGWRGLYGGARSSVYQKRKGKNSLKTLYTAPMSSTGGAKEKKRKEKKREE